MALLKIYKTKKRTGILADIGQDSPSNALAELDGMIESFVRECGYNPKLSSKKTASDSHEYKVQDVPDVIYQNIKDPTGNVIDQVVEKSLTDEVGTINTKVVEDKTRMIKPSKHVDYPVRWGKVPKYRLWAFFNMKDRSQDNSESMRNAFYEKHRIQQ